MGRVTLDAVSSQPLGCLAAPALGGCPPGLFNQGGGPLPEWPLATPLTAFGRPTSFPPGMRCGVVAGAEGAAFRGGVVRATEITLWESAGERYRLLIVPLLPDQSGCPGSST